MNTKSRRSPSHYPPMPETPARPSPGLEHELAHLAMPARPEFPDKTWFHGQGLAFPATLPVRPVGGKIGQPREPGFFAAKHSSPSRPPPMPRGNPRFR